MGGVRQLPHLWQLFPYGAKASNLHRRSRHNLFASRQRLHLSFKTMPSTQKRACLSPVNDNKEKRIMRISIEGNIGK